MTRLAVVVNPVKVADPEGLVDLLTHASHDAGWQAPLVLVTSADEPGTRQTRAALAEGVDLVVAAGGDGTVRAVCAALVGTRVPLAIVPAGTGNLLARNLGVPLLTAQAVRTCFEGADRCIDVGEVVIETMSRGGDGGGPRQRREVFVVMAGLGLDAAMMQEAPDSLKGRLGWPAYVVGAVRALRRRSVPVSITLASVPGRSKPLVLQARVRSVVVGNVGTLQAGLTLLPGAEPDDGLLDVCVVAPRHALDWVWIAVQVARRRPRTDQRLTRHQARSVVVRSRRRQPRQIDGELLPSGAGLTARLHRRALLCRVPLSAAAVPLNRTAGRASLPPTKPADGLAPLMNRAES